MKGVVFLDRDGVINAFPGKGLYVTEEAQFKFLPGSLEGIRLLKEAGCELYVVTNQGSVARGYITEAALRAMHEKMLAEVKKAGGAIDGVFYCPHQTSDACECKKPKVKLFRQALEGRETDWSKVWYVGDSEEDMAAGRTLGCRTILVLSGRLNEEDVPNVPARPDFVKKDLLEAARWIIREKS